MSAVHCRSCRHSKCDLSILRVLDRKVGTLDATSESGLGGWESRREATSFQGCIAALCPIPQTHMSPPKCSLDVPLWMPGPWDKKMTSLFVPTTNSS